MGLERGDMGGGNNEIESTENKTGRKSLVKWPPNIKITAPMNLLPVPGFEGGMFRIWV